MSSKIPEYVFPWWTKVMTTVLAGLILGGIVAGISASTDIKVLAQTIKGNQDETSRRLDYIIKDVSKIKADMGDTHNKLEEIDRRVFVLENENS